jgi:hypothetical protein
LKLRKRIIVWEGVQIITSLNGNELEFEVLKKVDWAFLLERCQRL